MRILAIPIGLATSILLARLLGPEQFGQYAFVMALVPLLALPVTGGMQTLLTREVAAYAHSGRWSAYKGVLNAAHGWVIAVSLLILVIYLLLVFCLEVIPHYGKWGLVPLALAMLPLLGLNAARNGVIKGLGMPAMAELPGMVIQPCLVLVALTGLILTTGLNVRGAIWIQVLSVAAAFLVATMIFIKISPPESKKVVPEYELKTWLGALAPFTLLALIGTFNAQLGIVALGVLGSDEQVGALSVAQRGAQFVALPLTLVNLIISPHIVKAFRSNDMRLLQKISRLSARGAFAIALPIGVSIFFLGEWLLEAFFGEEYARLSFMPLVLLVIGQLFNVFFGSVGLLLAMTGNERQSFKGQIVAVITNLILCAVLIPTMGATGAAIAVSTSIVVWNVILGVLVYIKVGIRASAL